MMLWHGVGTPKAETEGQSHRCSYATSHKVITSYRLPNNSCFAFISTVLCIKLIQSSFYHYCKCFENKTALN